MRVWVLLLMVSTHSRPKAAGSTLESEGYKYDVSTHSRPKAAGSSVVRALSLGGVSTHSRPKAAGPASLFYQPLLKGFNTQPPEGGWKFVDKD